ncbi:MAG: phytoene/squalene synthase family protein [Halobacteriota archaeon]
MTRSAISVTDPESLVNLPDDEFRAILLEGVSRTFALTIPQLPAALYSVVANAYLLCRIVDTIEDEVSLTPEQKEYFCAEFLNVVRSGQNGETFSAQLAPFLSEQTTPAERSLVHLIPRVMAMTQTLEKPQIEALATCVETMAKGMPVFQALDLQSGLKTLSDMANYCYCVAGCVGEMLAKLFCHYSPEIAVHEKELLELSVSFGQALQMTNILKDVWDDAERGVCWLPQDIFAEVGFSLENLTTKTNSDQFQHGLTHLISVNEEHLENALRFTLLIPSHETGIRKFCMWALSWAVLTLRNIKQNLNFTQSKQWKITRNRVKATILIINSLTVGSDLFLKLLFNQLSKGLETPDWHPSSSKLTPEESKLSMFVQAEPQRLVR